jgi:hypothetical protein
MQDIASVYAIYGDIIFASMIRLPQKIMAYGSLMARTAGKRHVALWIRGMTRYTKDCANAFQMELKDLNFLLS